MEHVPPLLAVAAAGALAPWLSSRTGALRIPIIVFEIGLGVLLGPQGFDVVAFDRGLPYLSTMGMAFLFFLAGAEIDLSQMRGAALRSAAGSWLVSLALAFAFAFVLGKLGGSPAWQLVAIALSTTALGIVVPILRDAELEDTGLGHLTIRTAALGELGPIVLMSLLLSRQYGPGIQSGLIVAFLVLIAGVFWASWAVRPPRLVAFLRRTMTQSGQMPVRLSVLLLIGLVVLAELFGLDLALGAFAAGMAVGLAMRDSKTEILQHKLDAIGFGMMVPIFFVCSGIQLDVHALFGSWSGVGMMLTYAGSLLVIRGAPAFLYRNELPSPHVKALALYSATTLSLIVAITGTAVRRGLMTPQHAASLVGGGLLSVVVFPVIATRLAKHGAPAKSNEHGEA